MDYDSDSELHATDTLRCYSDSEEDNQLNQGSKLPEKNLDKENDGKDSKLMETVEERITPDGHGGSSDEDDQIGQRTIIIGRKSKISNIIDSESDGDEVMPAVENKNDIAYTDSAHSIRLQSLLDSDSSEQEDVKPIKKTKTQSKRKTKRIGNALETLPRSDTDDEREADSKPSFKEKRKSKKDKKTEEISSVIRSAKDILASMTVKQAMEDRQIIQSESQRMAREKYIDVPYHRTKVFSFEEFRARKTICRPDPVRDCKGNSGSANKSIRMNAEQLVEFARKLEERELESQKFFKSESESADSEAEKDAPKEDNPTERQDNVAMDSHDTENQDQGEQNDREAIAVEPANDRSSPGNIPPATYTVKTTNEEQMDHIDEIVNQTSDNIERMISSFSETEKSTVQETERVQVNYDLFSKETPGSTSLAAKKATRLANLKLPPCPRLSGNSDMLIDLDSGTLQPREPSGADILFQRLIKCSGNAQKPATPASKAVSILSTDHGVVKLDTVTLFSNEERPLVNKEPIPGAAYLKLKQVLKEKIDNNRREFIRKREAEFAKKMDLEKAEQGDGMDEEEEEIELLDDDEEEEQDDSEDETTAADAADQQKETLLDDQALEDEMSEAEESASCDEEEEGDQQTAGGRKKAGRIIKAFEDSDDEVLPPNEEPKKSTQNERSRTQVSTLSSEESMALLWKDDDEQQEQREEEEDDLMALCSGQFATQLPTQKQTSLSQADKTPNPEALYTQNQEPFRESQLMDLCSGRFETQPNDEDSAANNTTTLKAAGLNDSDVCIGGRLRLDSSDDEQEGKESEHKIKTKKQKRKQINISDDEDETAEPDKPAMAKDISDAGDQEESEGDVEAEEDGERYVDYDSEENEVEVRLTKKEKELMSAKFLENEAELSESEWGSADEDEKDLDRYDVEVADEEQYDQQKLQQELEKIHNRQMLDQDDREVEQLKEFFLEDEENDGVGRVRQFRWKNVEKTFNLDYDKNAQEGDTEGGGNGSDEETELNWRKMRHERNLLLKEKNIDLSTIDLTASTLLNPADTTADTVDEQEIIQTGGKKRITIIKKGSTSTTAVKEDNPFLISNSTILQVQRIVKGHKASFLSRDQETLNKLANMIPETEGATSSVLTAKARNFVFATLSPAVVKSSKRSLDVEDGEVNANTKKAKTANKEVGSKKKLLLDSLK
uniref:Claspin n=1 Tax=Anopheles christyi TaxID=43041 RepID=A0A182JRJ2_9DIPT